MDQPTIVYDDREIDIRYAANRYVNEKDFAKSTEFAQFVKTLSSNETAYLKFCIGKYTTARLIMGPQPLDLGETGVQQPIQIASATPETIVPQPGDEITGPAIIKRGKNRERWCYASLGVKVNGGKLEIFTGASSPGASALSHAERDACSNLCEAKQLGNWHTGFQSDGAAFGKSLRDNNITIEFIYTEFPPCPGGCSKWVAAIGAKHVYFSAVLEGWFANGVGIGDKKRMWEKHLACCGIADE